MKIQQIRDALAADGYTHVVTYGGPLPLADWKPYGLVPGGVNYREGDREWQGEIIAPGTIRDLHCTKERCIVAEAEGTEGECALCRSAPPWDHLATMATGIWHAVKSVEWLDGDGYRQWHAKTNEGREYEGRTTWDHRTQQTAAKR